MGHWPDLELVTEKKNENCNSDDDIQFQLEDSLSTRMARLSRSNAARTTAAASPSLEPQRRSGSIDQGIKLRAGTAVLNRQEASRRVD